ncbi:MAG: hypothetical protein AVDCRST_MAG33-2627 [uncultured Thermomicrobiales bacterium]|uniref:Uncharacterized protein n=1 Tax=uncultured Thermomicrobiales bacterium TaxID=1645740 RepID=A0A6J4V8J2_9BACT|nr:MAG: hypothetical protein AVDCRST_MAG33-2627 [uncultured Thermomicrobiales bacterium]
MPGSPAGRTVTASSGRFAIVVSPGHAARQSRRRIAGPGSARPIRRITGMMQETSPFGEVGRPR